MVVPAKYGSAESFSEGLAAASLTPTIGSPSGFINKSGEFVIQPRFFWTAPFSDGLARTEKGFVNHAGEIVLPPVPANAQGFSQGWMQTYDGGATVFRDREGHVMLRTAYQGVESFSEDLAAACPNDCGPLTSGQNWGYINRKGEFVIKPQFGFKPQPFKEGLALVCFGCTG